MTTSLPAPETIYTDDQGIQSKVRCLEYQWKDTHVFATESRQEKPVRYAEKQDTPSLCMYFSLEGTGSAVTASRREDLQVAGNQHVLCYTPDFDGYYLVETPVTRNFGIDIGPAFFERLLSTELDCLLRLGDKIARGQVADLSPWPMPITPQQKWVIREMIHCGYEGHMQQLFHEAKLIELFLLQAQQAEDLMGRKPLQIKPADIEKLHAARQFVTLNMFEPISLQQVARAAGLNDFKLKKGFRELFGNTVFGYLNELKMNHARRLLQDGGVSVGDIAIDLGYSEPQNFTKAFKRYFGYTPGEVKG
ncbi:AraC family transcriptional regulator [Chitinophaga sp. XS-30]|uniref:helix-turn-helix transcriptional regulator n=1 Tax=Chitinophaga sp. XS-30 TaxID=2604421 RepID=UPI0011DD2FBF|nr:AraC family transcriptional regulator [Chitinophaga sp. XS-30]QEH41964.1 helix-turn-helix transcriptional regulator [Chitinophaga sp. XS-30]